MKKPRGNNRGLSLQVAGHRSRSGVRRIRHEEGNHAILKAALIQWEIRTGIRQ